MVLGPNLTKGVHTMATLTLPSYTRPARTRATRYPQRPVAYCQQGFMLPANHATWHYAPIAWVYPKRLRAAMHMHVANVAPWAPGYMATPQAM